MAKTHTSLGLDGVGRTTAGFPQHRRWWRLQGSLRVPDSPSSPHPVLHLIAHYSATGKENTKDIGKETDSLRPCSHACNSPYTQQRCHILKQVLTAAFPTSQKLAGINLQTIRHLSFPIPVWYRHAGITGNSPPEMTAGVERPPNYTRWMAKLR